MNAPTLSQSQLTRTTLIRLLSAIPVLLALFFWPAGTWDYWEAWLYLAVLFIPLSLNAFYMLRREPDLLQRRLKMKEKLTPQRLIISLSMLYFVLAFVLPGLDRRYGWSDVPAWLVLLADGVFLLGYALFSWVLRTNHYAARTVEVEQGQQVISTGPYAIIRHPMYGSVGQPVNQQNLRYLRQFEIDEAGHF